MSQYMVSFMFPSLMWNPQDLSQTSSLCTVLHCGMFLGFPSFSKQDELNN